jgi:hypothetical protein
MAKVWSNGEIGLSCTRDRRKMSNPVSDLNPFPAEYLGDSHRAQVRLPPPLGVCEGNVRFHDDYLDEAGKLG